ncbi:uncharacterized protein LOC131693609 [Topomyia yanbarensis]|uniref:uncharacterized protein LOC131693609 n=1 Tax=Topomyia yanbarensis TaxID=2498891 RepID=UPI00273ACB3C|nr:uncharacterized protein LOC131693609 [Topomyia yanbarensis]
MTSWKKLLVVLVLGVVAVVCEETAAEELPKDVDEGRGRKRMFKFLFKLLTPMVSSLSYILLIKAKVVVVGLFLVGIYFFGHKLWPGGFCGHSIVSDVPPPYLDGYSGISGLSGISGYHSSGPEILSSYPGPEPWSVPGSYGPPTGSSPPSLPPSIGDGVKYGSRRGRRDLMNPEDEELLDNEMYWTDQITDMAFRFLGVSARECRKRFVCEFDFHARRNPLLLFATRAMGRDIFHNYRDANDERARYYQDCGRIYANCSVPKRSPPRQTRRKGHLPTTTTEEPEPEESSSASIEQEDEAGNEIAGEENSRKSLQSEWQPLTSEPMGKLILRRTQRDQPSSVSENQ